MRDERGSVSLFLALGVAGVGAMIVLQMSIAYKSVHRQQSKQKGAFTTEQSLVQLAQFFKQANDLHGLSQANGENCTTAARNRQTRENGSEGEGQIAISSRERPQLRQRRIGGLNFCLPSSNEYCVRFVENGVSRQACASSGDNSLDWRREPGGEAGGNHRPSEGQASARSQVRNRINIPPQSNDEIWRECSAPTGDSSFGCLRIALCEEGQRTCTERQAVAYQVVRLGTLNSTSQRRLALAAHERELTEGRNRDSRERAQRSQAALSNEREERSGQSTNRRREDSREDRREARQERRESNEARRSQSATQNSSGSRNSPTSSSRR